MKKTLILYTMSFVSIEGLTQNYSSKVDIM